MIRVLARPLAGAFLLAAVMTGPGTAEELRLLETSGLEAQAHVAATSPSFVAAQKRSGKVNYPLFIFVPGIIGSQLDRTTGSKMTTLWGLYDNSTPDLSILPGDDTAITPTILYDFKVGTLHKVDAYASGIQEIMDARLGVDLLAYFPYDWRQNNARTAERLNDWLCDELRYAQMKDREIRFLAHSMGGLVVKEWFRRYDGKPSCRVNGTDTREPRQLKIAEVVFLGTPHFGAPAAIKTLASGFNLVAKSFGGWLGMWGTKLDQGTVSNALNEYGTLFPSVYQLLPIYHEHSSDCMNSYSIPIDKWPPHIADTQGLGDKFAHFNWQAWKAYGWPKKIPRSISREEFYKDFLATTLPEARAFLCRLAQYRFPPQVRVRYFASNSMPTDTSYEIQKTPWWKFWKDRWVLEDIGRPPWTNGDGTVPEFVGRNQLALGIAQFEDLNLTDRKECKLEHSSLLNCTEFAKYIRDAMTIAEHAQHEAAVAYLESHPAEKDTVLQTLADARLFLNCRLNGPEAFSGASFSACPLNDEIRERAGIDVATLLAETKAAAPSPDKAAKLDVVAAMRGLDRPERIVAADNVALASYEAGDLNRGRDTFAALGGGPGAGAVNEPLTPGDKIFVNSPLSNKLYALNLEGKPTIAWSHQPQVDPAVIPVMCCETTNPGLAFAGNTIFKYEPDTTLVALDAETGRELWKTRTGDPNRGDIGSQTPLVMNDKVLIGVSGAEFGARGYVTALDAKSGKKIWKAYSRGPDDDILVDPERTIAMGKPVGRDSGLKTWTGDQWKLGGAAPETELVFDPELKLMFYVTGEASPIQPTQTMESWSRSLFAREIESGKARWLYKLPPEKQLGGDLERGFELMQGKPELKLAQRTIGGAERKLVEYLDHSGMLYALDRESGELLESSAPKSAETKRAPAH